MIIANGTKVKICPHCGKEIFEMRVENGNFIYMNTTPVGFRFNVAGKSALYGHRGNLIKCDIVDAAEADGHAYKEHWLECCQTDIFSRPQPRSTRYMRYLRM